MKQQTFIVFFETADGGQVTFERFSCRRIATVKSRIRGLWKSSLYRACTKGAEVVKIYATPDGYNRESRPVETMKLATT